MSYSDPPISNREPVAALSYARADVRTPGPVGRFMLRPAGWVLAATAAVAAAVTLVVAADVVDLSLLGVFLSGFLWLLVVAGLAVRMFGHVAAVATYGRPDGGRSRWWRWLIAPGLLAVTYALCRADVPTAVAFRLSRSAMERSAIAALARPDATPLPMSVGLYGTSTPEVDHGTVYFMIAGMSFIDRDGYAYSPAGPPAQYRCWPVGGPWYRWHEKF